MSDPNKLTPEEFEGLVERTLRDEGDLPEGLETARRVVVLSTDGEYEIDVTARFRALGGDYLVLIECKRYAKPIERELVQVLHRKLESCAAQKAMLWSTSEFRRGAREYALAHGIALVRVMDGGVYYRTRSEGGSAEGVSRPAPLLVMDTDEGHDLLLGNVIVGNDSLPSRRALAAFFAHSRNGRDSR